MLKLAVVCVLLTSVLSADPPLQICTTADECAEIDICESLNKDQWMHVEHASINLTGVHTPDTARRKFDIKTVTLPLGVKVEVCEPDFAEYVAGRNWTCYEKSVIKIVREGYNVISQSEDFRFQMIMFKLLPSYGCDQTATVGYRLEPANARLQALLPCAADVPNGHWSHSCDLVCDEDFVVTDNQECEKQCIDSVSKCEPTQFATSTCTMDSGIEMYKCGDCVPVAGTQTVSWVAGQDCTYQDCNEGTYGHDGSCVECSVNEYSDGSTPCASCNTAITGTYQPEPGRGTCLQCFGTEYTGATCDEGRMFHNNFTLISAYFRTHSSFTEGEKMFAYCLDGGACLPCQPGSRESDGTCVLCEPGTYQNGFAQTSCLKCAANQTTLHLGSVASTDCVCGPGVEILT